MESQPEIESWILELRAKIHQPTERSADCLVLPTEDQTLVRIPSLDAHHTRQQWLLQETSSELDKRRNRSKVLPKHC